MYRISDEEIIDLFFARDERGLLYAEKKYGRIVRSLCGRILSNKEDAEECQNSVFFIAWSKIPPEKPKSLAAFLSRLARDVSIDRYRAGRSEKRTGDRLAVRYEELSDLLTDDDSGPLSVLEQKETADMLRRFIFSLSDADRRIFLMRYYDEQTLAEISKNAGLSIQGVAFRLNKMKEELKKTLEKEGYPL